MSRSQIAALVADVFSNVAVAENKVIKETIYQLILPNCSNVVVLQLASQHHETNLLCNLFATALRASMEHRNFSISLYVPVR